MAEYADSIGDGLVLGLRDALLSPEVLPGFDVTDDGGEPTPLDELWAQIRRSRRWCGVCGATLRCPVGCEQVGRLR
ncbi:MAG TPA: hypothetical protein VGP31_12805 [Planosporangium sp.]|jgi:hypothetical protein|nr:hypothetical protein [Planosporangium sp.]